MAGRMTAARLAPFGTSIFTEITGLAIQHGAINLAQGFPDFDGPPEILEAAAAAMRAGQNQYARSPGLPALAQAIAARQERRHGMAFDWASEVVVTTGATEGLAAAMLGLVNPGDEVILFEPFYDSYPACVAMAGATARFCPLHFPDFALDVTALAGLFNERTRLLVLNSPHNPSGKVFSRDELQALAELCRRHDVLVLTDEVYEHLTFGRAEHVPLASLPGMRERTLTLSSTGKTFSLTGWKIGWAIGPAPLVAATQAAHQFLTFCAPTPLQAAMALALTEFGDDYLAEYRQAYVERRTLLLDILRASGFQPAAPEGTYFALVAFEGLDDRDDRAFTQRLIADIGVAAIPASAFYHQHVEEGRRLLRFAFCKRLETLHAAGERLRVLGP